MTYPKFFDEIETIVLKDDLASFLGACKNGIIEFSYIDIVKSAGHSCPSVLGAYLLTKNALKALYVNELPRRGEIEVSFKNSLEEGVTGVLANVISNITGASSKSGFKGINSKFSRVDLMHFSKEMSLDVKFTRVDTKQSVELKYLPEKISPSEKMQSLMKLCLENRANEKEKEEFATLWQERVKQISLNEKLVIQLEHL